MPTKTSTNSRTQQGPSICTCINVRRASRAITRIYDKALEPSGLKITQFSTLMNINYHGPLNVSDLSLIMNLDRTTLVRNLKALETAGFIENVATADPRERRISITESGREVIDRALPHWRTVQKQIKERIGRDNAELLGILADSLERLSHDLDEAAG